MKPSTCVHMNMAYKSKSSHENHPFLESLWKNPACLPQKPGRLFLVLLRSQNTTEFLEVWTILHSGKPQNNTVSNVYGIYK